MFISTGNNLRHCCEIWPFRSGKVPMRMSRANERLQNWRGGATHLQTPRSAHGSSRLDAGDYPKSLTEFSKELAEPGSAEPGRPQ